MYVFFLTKFFNLISTALVFSPKQIQTNPNPASRCCCSNEHLSTSERVFWIYFQNETLLLQLTYFINSPESNYIITIENLFLPIFYLYYDLFFNWNKFLSIQKNKSSINK